MNKRSLLLASALVFCPLTETGAAVNRLLQEAPTECRGEKGSFSFDPVKRMIIHRREELLSQFLGFSARYNTPTTNVVNITVYTDDDLPEVAAGLAQEVSDGHPSLICSHVVEHVQQAISGNHKPSGPLELLPDMTDSRISFDHF